MNFKNLLLVIQLVTLGSAATLNKRETTCEVNLFSRKKCGDDGISKKECIQKECCWASKVNDGFPQCYYSKVIEECDVDSYNRYLCGKPDISEKDCLSQGCCWRDNENQYGIPKCFKPRSSFSATTTLPKPAPKPTSSSKHNYCNKTGYKLCPPMTPEVYEDEKEGCVYGLDKHGHWCLVRSNAFPKFETELRRCYTMSQHSSIKKICTSMGGKLALTHTNGLCGENATICDCPGFTTCIPKSTSTRRHTKA